MAIEPLTAYSHGRFRGNGREQVAGSRPAIPQTVGWGALVAGMMMVGPCSAGPVSLALRERGCGNDVRANAGRSTTTRTAALCSLLTNSFTFAVEPRNTVARQLCGAGRTWCKSARRSTPRRRFQVAERVET